MKLMDTKDYSAVGIAQAVTVLRKRKGISREELAHVAELPVRTIDELEEQKIAELDVLTLLNIIRAFKISASEFMELTKFEQQHSS